MQTTSTPLNRYTTRKGLVRLAARLRKLVRSCQREELRGSRRHAARNPLYRRFSDAYPLPFVEASSRENPAISPRYWLDPAPIIAGVTADVRKARGPEVVSSRFHATLVAAVVDIATRVNASTVALSGGFFQNRRLTDLCVRSLQSHGIVTLVHRRVPANDGGLRLGQAVVARSRLVAERGWRADAR